MNEADLLKCITANPKIFGGKPIVRGRRLAVEHVLGMLAAGDTVDDLLRAYPWLEREDFSFVVETRGRSKGTSSVPKGISKITRRAPRERSRAAAASLPYEPWLIKQLKDPAEAAAYLEAVIEEGDQAALMLALRQVAKAQGGIAEIARKAKLTREATYKMLSKSGNPELRSLKAVLAATGLRIAVRPIQKRAA